MKVESPGEAKKAEDQREPGRPRPRGAEALPVSPHREEACRVEGDAVHRVGAGQRRSGGLGLGEARMRKQMRDCSSPCSCWLDALPRRRRNPRFHRGWSPSRPSPRRSIRQSGTFSVRARPTAAGAARGMTGLEITEVTVDERRQPLVQLDGRPWVRHGPRRLPGDMGRAGHGDVASRRAHLAGRCVCRDHQLGGYGAGQRGLQQRAGADGPEHAAGLGLWYYDKVMYGGSATAGWTFNYAGGGRFSFSGRIVAAKVDEMTGGARHC